MCLLLDILTTWASIAALVSARRTSAAGAAGKQPQSNLPQPADIANPGADVAHANVTATHRSPAAAVAEVVEGAMPQQQLHMPDSSVNMTQTSAQAAPVVVVHIPPETAQEQARHATAAATAGQHHATAEDEDEYVEMQPDHTNKDSSKWRYVRDKDIAASTGYSSDTLVSVCHMHTAAV